MQGLDAKNILARAQEVDQASINEGLNNTTQIVQRYSIDLSKERSDQNPFALNFAFKSITVEDASDPSALVYMRPITRDDLQSHFRLKQNDSWSVDYTIPKAFLHWPAQPGKKIELLLFTSSQFRSGSQLSVNAGGVSINDGSSASGPLAVTLLAATAAAIAPTLLTRKSATIENKTGGPIWVSGDPTVNNAGATEGILIGAGDIIKWRNTAALYAYSVAGGKVSRFEEA